MVSPLCFPNPQSGKISAERFCVMKGREEIGEGGGSERGGGGRVLELKRWSFDFTAHTWNDYGGIFQISLNQGAYASEQPSVLEFVQINHLNIHKNKSKRMRIYIKKRDETLKGKRK